MKFIIGIIGIGILLAQIELSSDIFKANNSSYNRNLSIVEIIELINADINEIDFSFEIDNDSTYAWKNLNLQSKKNTNYFVVKSPDFNQSFRKEPDYSLVVKYNEYFFDIAKLEFDSQTKLFDNNPYVIVILDSTFLLRAIVYSRKENRLGPKNWKTLPKDSIREVKSLRITQYNIGNDFAEKRLCLVDYFDLKQSSIEEIYNKFLLMEQSNAYIGSWSRISAPCTSLNIAIKRPDLCK